MTSTFFTMCQSCSTKKHSSHSRRAWEHLNAQFETVPALPAITPLITLGSHPHPGEKSVETASCDRTVTLPMAQMLLQAKSTPVNEIADYTWLSEQLCSFSLLTSYKPQVLLALVWFGFCFNLSIHKTSICASCSGLAKAPAIPGKQIFTHLGCLQLSGHFKCRGQSSAPTKLLTTKEQPYVPCCQARASKPLGI